MLPPVLIRSLLVLVLTALVATMLVKQTNSLVRHSVELFEVNRNPSTLTANGNPYICSVLTNAASDDEVQKSLLEKKVTQVKNDGLNFRYFNNSEKPFDSDKYQYCYVNTFEQVKPDGAPPCNMNQPQYRFPMVNSVNVGAVMEPGKAVPRQVCIMEIDPKKVFSRDVLQFSNLVNNFDSKHMIEKVEACESQLQASDAKYNSLSDEYQRMSEELKTLYVQQEQCLSDKALFLQNNTLLNAENEAATGMAVLIDTKHAYSRLSFDVSFGSKQYDIPTSFEIAYVFLPPNYKARLFKEDGVFFDFTHEASSYPRIDAKIAESVTGIRFISKAEEK